MRATKARSILPAEEVSFVSVEHHIRSRTGRHLRQVLVDSHERCRHDSYILRCRLHMTCPHSVSQKGTCGGVDGSEEKGRWHLEQVTNSQISRSVCEDEIWDMPWDGRVRVSAVSVSTVLTPRNPFT